MKTFLLKKPACADSWNCSRNLYNGLLYFLFSIPRGCCFHTQQHSGHRKLLPSSNTATITKKNAAVCHFTSSRNRKNDYFFLHMVLEEAKPFSCFCLKCFMHASEHVFSAKVANGRIRQTSAAASAAPNNLIFS